MKRFEGQLDNWRRHYFNVEANRVTIPEDSLGYFITGFNDKRQRGRQTSPVVKFDEANMTVETLNSIYKLGKPADT